MASATLYGYKTECKTTTIETVDSYLATTLNKRPLHSDYEILIVDLLNLGRKRVIDKALRVIGSDLREDLRLARLVLASGGWCTGKAPARK